MLLCFSSLSLDDISDIISITTPIILLIWFYYSQRHTLSKNYFRELDGIYAGFTEPVNKEIDTKGLSAGIIMNIRDTDESGYFKGDFDYAETKAELIDNEISFRNLRDGVHSFIGKMDFEIYANKIRHPYKPEENRVYKGILYIVDRLDFSFENYKIETYLRAEYNIIHYREMQTLKFTIKKIHKTDGPQLPESFTLYKKMGFSFEPYRNVKTMVFRGNTRTDK
jgi:hypothetical protein